MISNRNRARGKLLKMPRNIQRLYKEGKCMDCSVVVSRMDFAKILGKFTKVKIQYESSTPKAKKSTTHVTAPNSRLKRNANGMVLIHRNAYSPHPAKELLNTTKSKANATPQINNVKENNRTKGNSSPRQRNNILKENNRLKRTPASKNKNRNYSANNNPNLKQYGIVFVNPIKINNNDIQSKLALTDLLPYINKDILPSKGWCIDYFPKDDEPKDDKVYDRIAAELEDLMYNEKPKSKTADSKQDDFPSILDILNDNTNDNISIESNHSVSTEFKPNLESSDVEAMLLGTPNDGKKEPGSTSIEVDNSDTSNLIAVTDLITNIKPVSTEDMDNPNSPSILDETLQKGIEEHLPGDQSLKEIPDLKVENISCIDTAEPSLQVRKDAIVETKENSDDSVINKITITHVVFKKSLNGKCYKSVTCPKNLKYNVELEGKSVEFLGAPKLISSLGDLQVLLQIVDESELDSLYVLH